MSEPPVLTPGVRSRVVAHRGLWRAGHAQNSPDAIAAALSAGFGVELDVYANPGDYLLTVGHDAGAQYDLSRAIPALHAGAGTVLFNVKSKGCEHGMRLLQARHPALWERSFWFDWDYRDTDPGLVRRFALANYLYRPEVQIDMSPGDGDGWWIDLDQTAPPPGRMVEFYVSPELHGRVVDLALWKEWLGRGGSICTDFPQLAALVFEAPELQPVEPWWNA